MKIAVIAVAYNRVDSLERLLNSLDKAYYNERVTLIISVDKSQTNEVEAYADNYQWLHGDKIVNKHKENLGLRSHMLSLGKWFEQFDALVVLEDDIVVSPNYYSYVCQTVNKYRNIPAIAGISLYSIRVNYQTGNPFTPMRDQNDVYFVNCAMSWGEVWMKDSWKLFYEWYLSHTDFPEASHLPRSICQWNKKSWLKYHIRYCIEENKYFVHPYTSLSTNFSDKGEHWSAGQNTVYQVPLQHGEVLDFRLPDFGAKAVYYDGFFENKSLYSVLGMVEDDLCIDLQGENRNRLRKRYWLTNEVADYKIVKTFGLNYRPIEENIFCDNQGKGIFLYDTSVVEKNKMRANRKVYLYNYHLGNMFIFLKKYGLGNTWRDFCEYLSNIVRKS